MFSQDRALLNNLCAVAHQHVLDEEASAAAVQPALAAGGAKAHPMIWVGLLGDIQVMSRPRWVRNISQYIFVRFYLFVLLLIVNNYDYKK